jgi:hypothetical protein
MARAYDKQGFSTRRTWLMALVGAAMLAAWQPFAANRPASADEPAAQQAEPKQSKTVQLTIDYGDGVQKVFRELEWKEGMTVQGALEAAAKHPRGIKFAHQGSGATAFVTAIDDQKNEGTGRNWTYEVNGKKANKSCGIWPLKAGDSVLWRFAEYE